MPCLSKQPITQWFRKSRIDLAISESIWLAGWRRGREEGGGKSGRIPAAPGVLPAGWPPRLPRFRVARSEVIAEGGFGECVGQTAIGAVGRHQHTTRCPWTSRRH
jgi:hypothetical protein